MALLSPADLLEARWAAADRFMAIAQRHTPPDIEITYHKGLYGRAWVETRKMHVPIPTTRRRLHIYLHEVGHIVLDHRRKKPVHVQEMEAEKFAFRIMREEGIPVPRKSMAQAKRYVGWKIRQAKKRGAKHIDAEAARFAKR